MSQSHKLINLSPQVREDFFIIVTCDKCDNDYTIYKAFEKTSEMIDYRLIEMASTNYCPFCGSKNE